MTIAPVEFKRLVLGFQPRAHEDALRLAVELANILGLDLVGLFLRDTNLDKLANIPFAREFRVLGGGWRPIDIHQLVRELDLAAGRMERAFMAAAAQVSMRCRFEVKHGPTAETISSISEATDIVVIFEPESPAERTSQQFSALLAAAFESAAAVMLVPSRVVRHSGPIVVLAADADDPSIVAAAQIAAITKDEVIVLQKDGAAIRQPVITPSDAAALIHGYRLNERLVMISRSSVEASAALAIASARRAPLLIIEPPSIGANREKSRKQQSAGGQQQP